MTMAEPRWGDVIKMPAGGFEELPNAEVPYKVAADEGIFLHRRMHLGRGVVKLSKTDLPKMGTWTGIFDFTAPPIPGALMAQVADFFRRTYRRLHAEAAVLLTMNEETKEWGVFIPTQLVSHGGVNYVYDPTMIQRPRYVVGSIHSHCDFSPFHSGTDTGDADEFDGLHMTIGFIEREKPGIVAMMAMNKAKMHYKEDQFPEIFDFSQLWTTEAPAWWDQYVGGHNDKPVGFELYKKFEKPTIIKEESASKITVAKGQHGVVTLPGIGVSRTAVSPRNGMGFRSGWPEMGAYGFREVRPGVWEKIPAGLSTESMEFNKRKAAERGLRWTEDGGLDLTQLGLKVSDVTPEEIAFLQDLERADRERDVPPADWSPQREGEFDPIDFVAMIMDMNVLTEEDYEWAQEQEEAASRPGEWREIFIRKLWDCALILDDLGQKVDISFGPKPPMDLQMELLPESGKGSEDMIGVH